MTSQRACASNYSRVEVTSVCAVSSGEDIVSGQQHAATGVATEELQRSLTTQIQMLCCEFRTVVY